MPPLTPQMLEMLLHYALGISAMFAGSRIVVALLQRRDRVRTEEALDLLHARLARLEQATEYIAGALPVVDDTSRLGSAASRPRTPVPLPASPSTTRTPH